MFPPLSVPSTPAWQRLRTLAATTRGRPLDVLGIGECSLDRVVRLAAPLSTLAPHTTKTAGKTSAHTIECLGGGQIATALCAASRLGATTAFLGAIGTDATGQQVLQGLVDDRVDTRFVLRIPSAVTRTALILVEPSGERAVIEHRDALLALRIEDLPVDLLATARAVHLDASFPGAARHAAQLARRHGAIVSLDLDQPTEDALSLLPLADLAIVSLDFARARFPTLSPHAALSALHRAYTPTAVLVATQGPAGSWICTGAADEITVQPAYVPPASIVDTTACGDTYRAAFLAALLLDSPISAADPPAHPHLVSIPAFAAAAAALKCLDLGRRGCPTRAQVTSFLATSPRALPCETP